MSKKLIGASVLAAVALAGCGTLSQVDDAGHTDEPIWPKTEQANVKQGTYPNLSNLRQVHEGATREQLYGLLGSPHFSEGFGTREWDYLFNFNTPEGVKMCQYKVLFDKDKTAQSFYWQPADCSGVLNDGAVKE